ncbi:NAD(P)/FAD-dependent oxidoreductase [Prescottella sp. R16]|uniref:flavin-containing monooxygenase n=1 Tax=Prescottella sp. R16 TaxID=3064529 RepID=UPI00272E7EF8|nr:NAD(P)/FAD-dependent oxidoreductase [Prescottella sp. R16]
MTIHTGTEPESVTLDPAIDKDAIRARYAEERDKRIRPEGINQYHRLEGKFAELADDPWTPVQEREPVTDHVTFTFIGGGFSGLCAGAQLKKRGVDDVRIIDTAGGFGGVWYWNRYPGAMCDTKSVVYMPLLEETGYVPTELWAHGPEILEHAGRIGKHFGLYDNALFHTKVTNATWDETSSRWTVETNRGDRFTTQFLGIGLGPLSTAKLPGVPGIEDFAGQTMHTSRWNYSYTGGDALGAPMTGLADKRVGVIGTGATAIQLIPELAKYAEELFVFQRTPSSVAERGNGPLDEATLQILKEPGGQEKLLDSFTRNWDGFFGKPEPGVVVEDLVDDAWTSLGRRMRAQMHSVPLEQMSPETVMAAVGDLDLTLMEERRARIDSIVEDPTTAENLKPWYDLFCKRPGFHDDYLPAFNRPNVHLVDTAGQGVERITPTGVVVDGQEYPVDCLIYASGFEYGTGGSEIVNRAGFEVVGRGGIELSEAWADGMETLHGMHVHGYPNMFIIQLWQGSFLGANVTQSNNYAAENIAAIVEKVLAEGNDEVEVTKEAQDEWVEMLLRDGVPFGRPDCTPGYYNDDGHTEGRTFKLNVGDPRGSYSFVTMIQEWCRRGEFPELARRRTNSI